jgi:DNA-binding NtrC family response regulator
MARILLIEPDRPICEFIAGILTEFGHDVRACGNLIEANVWVATSPFDVLVTDIAPRGDQGAALSRTCSGLGIRMVTLTGRELHGEQGEAGRAPSFAEKPFRFSDLQRVLDAIEAPSPIATVRDERSEVA